MENLDTDVRVLMVKGSTASRAWAVLRLVLGDI